MDLLLVYEDKAAVDREGNVYIGTAFSNSALECYFQHFDHVTMLVRRADVSPDDTKRLTGMNKVTTDRLSVVFLPNPTADMKSFIDPKVHREYKQTVLEQITPDRAVIVRVPSDSGTIAADYCHKIGKPYLAEAIGCPWDSLWNHSIKGKALAPKMREDMRRVMRNAPYSVYVTNEFLQRRYPTKGVTAAISDVELRPMEQSVLDARLAHIRNHSGKIKIATSGGLVAYKGQQFVIEALAKLKAQGNTNYEYHLAGSGDDVTLRNLARELGVEDQVIFEGRLAHEQMFPWLDEMDLYIQPSMTEGMPRSLIEAMSRGLPALGTQTGGIPELLGPDCTFPRKDVDAILKIVSSLEPTDMEQMAQNNFNRCASFQKELLDQKRFDFYAAFAKAAEAQK
jgi:glycosyltransferase involved in cell wall biosynthesis